MIGKCKAIAHGAADISYITGETANKEHPEKIFHVLNKHIDNELDAAGIWDTMKKHCARYRDRHPKLKNPIFRIELSPPKEYTKNFTLKDWEDLWNEFIREYDKTERSKNGKYFASKTNLADSMQTVWLHLESKGGTPHLHGAVSVIDMNGNASDSHWSMLRAGEAAETVAIRRGWLTAMKIHEDRLPEVSKDCSEALLSMDSFNLQDFFHCLALRGYDVKTKVDSKGIIHGYALVKDNCKYKASELGRNGEFKVGKLEATWKRLHDSEKKHREFEQKDYTRQFDRSVHHEFSYDGIDYSLYIPDHIDEMLGEMYPEDEIKNCDEIIHCAILAFVGYIDAATTIAPSAGGGGGSSTDDDKKKNEEEELAWLRRCARFAEHRHPVVRKSRGWHR